MKLQPMLIISKWHSLFLNKYYITVVHMHSDNIILIYGSVDIGMEGR